MAKEEQYSSFTFGSLEMRDVFRQSSRYVMVNHGAYGLSPQPVMEKKFELIKEQESQPDIWFRVNMMKYYMESVKIAANIIGAHVDDTFILNNATEGTNCVLKSLDFGKDGEILMNSHSYLAVKNTAEEMESTSGIRTRYVPIKFPIADEQEIVNLYESYLDQYPNVKIAIMDHITSPTALKLPVEKIVEICRQRDVLTLIDGAHVPGQLQLDIKKINPDFYVGNLHKWYYTFRSCGLLWVSPKHKNQIRPLVTSNYSDLSMHHRFCYWGTRDTSSQFTLATAHQFYNDVGGLEAITEYNSSLVTWAQSMLCDALGTKPLEIPSSMRAPNMAVLHLPEQPGKALCGNELIEVFLEKYNGMTVGFLDVMGEVVLRLSANIYNCKEDYYKLRDALVDYFSISKS
uniref:Aminotransferase class V domain-containing protein n=1 Tax=Ciona savignyi TaxID=51511 RepID=H2YXV6_CIOSA